MPNGLPITSPAIIPILVVLAQTWLSSHWLSIMLVLARANIGRIKNANRFIGKKMCERIYERRPFRLLLKKEIVKAT
jgi:hypothetical protein